MSEGSPGNPGTGPREGSSRSASVNLRTTAEVGDQSALMDPANQSLADALKITFRILQVAMAVLAGLYVLSGFQSVKATERGVRLTFGEVRAQDLPSGFQFAWPFPVGELIKVDVGNNDLEIDREFWPFVEPGKEDDPAENLVARASLSPQQDGSLLTGDGAIAHTQWEASFVRSDVKSYAERVYPPHENAIVKAMVQRGIVQAVAEVTIDDLLKQSASAEGSVARRARNIAQGMLDELGAGDGTPIVLEQLSLKRKIPPAYLREAFNSVLAASSEASTASEKAQKDGNTLLANTAGSAAGTLIELIDEYERHIDAGLGEEAAETLTLINSVFDRQPIELDGAEVLVQIGGEVSTMLEEAMLYRTAVVDIARRDLESFESKLELFESNPSVMITGEWTSALAQFFGDENVTVYFNPPGVDTYELVINKDPSIAADAERRRRLEENEKARDLRQQEMEEDRLRTREGGLNVRG